MIIASHLVLTGYGHWLANDLRGSGSTEIREEKFKPLGDIHFGRKHPQPPRDELKKFWRRAEPLLKHELVWFDERLRLTIVDSFRKLIASKGYVVWGCAVLQNHAHVCVRRHRDRPDVIWGAFADASRTALREAELVPPDHPVWSLRPYAVYLNAPPEVVTRVDYIWDNFEKSRLTPERYDFVRDYDGWTNGVRVVRRSPPPPR
jgi:hypothetical protein